jgi:hypothetical protein
MCARVLGALCVPGISSAPVLCSVLSSLSRFSLLTLRHGLPDEQPATMALRCAVNGVPRRSVSLPTADLCDEAGLDVSKIPSHKVKSWKYFSSGLTPQFSSHVL